MTDAHATPASRRTRNGFGVVSAWLVSLALVGCNTLGTPLNGPVATDPNAPQARVADDFPVPSGSRVLTDETLVLGSGNNWTGRLSLALSVDAQAAYVHFRDQAKSFGWSLVSGSFGTTSILTFAKAQRSATVLIQDGNRLQGIKATITVSPMAIPVTK